MSTPPRLIACLKKAYDALEDAQAHANSFDRPVLGRDLDDIRWRLGDFIANLEIDERLEAIR
jgi:hypothetical protein